MQVQPRFVTRMGRPAPAVAVPVVTAAFGRGSVLVSDRAVQAVWEGVDLPSFRRGAVNVEARVLVDGEGAWTVQAALVESAGAQPFDGHLLRAAREEAGAALGTEVLAAAGQAMLARPGEMVEAIRNGPSGVDDEIVAAAVTRVLERLETDPRLQEAERALAATRPAGEPTPREAVEEAARSMRAGGPAFF